MAGTFFELSLRSVTLVTSLAAVLLDSSKITKYQRIDHATIVRLSSFLFTVPCFLLCFANDSATELLNTGCVEVPWRQSRQNIDVGVSYGFTNGDPCFCVQPHLA